jgi:hypothetical protein
MKRRQFLQLAAAAAAGALVQQTFALSAAPQTSPCADILSLHAGEPSMSALAAFPAASNDKFHELPAQPHQLVEMLLERTTRGAERWIIDGRPTEALFLQPARRYRLRMMNATGAVHTVHLQNHKFALARIHQAPVSRMFESTIRLGRYHVVEADILMSRPGPLLLHYLSS